MALGVPLTGVQLIEASAGRARPGPCRGSSCASSWRRTYRWVGILAVTFTRAATAELRERIRGRLGAMLDLLEGRGTDDGLCTLLAARLTDTGRARLKLRAALYGFDDAALYTIHGFCQRVLRDRAFRAPCPSRPRSWPMPASCSTRWLRTSRADRSPRRPSHKTAARKPCSMTLSSRGCSRGTSRPVPARWLGPLLDKHELRVELPPEPPGGVGLIERYGLLRDRVSELWRAERSDILARLATGLRRNAYRADRVRDWAAEIDAYFREDGDPLALPPRLHRFTTLRLAAASTGAPPSHEFFTLAEDS